MNNKILISLMIIASLFVSGCIGGSEEYKYSEKISGVNVYSDIQLSDFSGWDELLLISKDDKTIRQCNLELTAISKSITHGPEVTIEKNNEGGINPGIYIHKNSIEIKGRNDAEIMSACHVFACLAGNITCPGNLNKIHDITSNANRLNIIRDADMFSGEGFLGYIELMQYLGKLQTDNFGKDKNFYIYPYAKENGVCKLLPFENYYQIINETVANQTENDCNMDGIFLHRSDKNEIKVVGNKIMLYGDDEHLRNEVIIVSDIILPDLRYNSFYGN